MKVMITGHRPSNLGGYSPDNLNAKRILNEISVLLNNINEVVPVTGLTGMAIGTDQYFANACLNLDIPFVAYVPFEGQENVWPTPAREEYRYLLSQSIDVIKVSQGNYTPKKMKLRNQALADDADLAIAVWNGEKKGGTYHCVSYLRKQAKVPIIFIEA